MNAEHLSMLEPVNLRDVWPSESRDFTPWLAQEGNLAMLGKAVKMDLQFPKTEYYVGEQRADILCQDLTLNRTVVIENQLERADHCHLGQILTYAAGVKASCIIWIAERFIDEHRATLDWLNENTGENIHFFGIEMELWKIGNSSPAPNFKVIVQPNEWSNKMTEATKKIKSEVLSDQRELQLSYWTAFIPILTESKVFVPPKAEANHYLSVRIGKSDIKLCPTIYLRERYIGVEVYFSGSNAKKNYARISLDRNLIEAEIGSQLEWQDLPKKKACRVILKNHNVDIEDLDDWQNQHRWIQKTLINFQNVFLPLINALR